MGICGQGPARPNENSKSKEDTEVINSKPKRCKTNNNEKDNINSRGCPGPESITLHNINIMYTNIDSITNKQMELQDFLNSLDPANTPHIIAITEVNAKHCKYPLQESELQITGYNLYCSNIGELHYRGVLIYVSTDLQAIELEMCKNFNEHLTVNIQDS